MPTHKIKSPAVIGVLSSFKEKLDADKNIDELTIEKLFAEISNNSAITAPKLEEALFSSFSSEEEE